MDWLVGLADILEEGGPLKRLLLLGRSSLVLKLAGAILARRGLREEFRDEFICMLNYLSFIDKALKLESTTVQIWLCKCWTIALSPVLAVLTVGRTNRQLWLLSTQIKKNICELDRDHVRVTAGKRRGDRAIRISIDVNELKKIYRWALKASLWPEQQFYPRPREVIELKDTVPYLKPSWQQPPWQRHGR